MRSCKFRVDRNGRVERERGVDGELQQAAGVARAQLGFSRLEGANELTIPP